jgi:hypothetical protein
MAGEYVFGTNYGLLSVGSAKTGSMLDFDDYYKPLAAGKTFGDAYKDWWTYETASGVSSYQLDWFYGMTTIGDPTLRMQAFNVPEPTSAAMLVGLVGLVLLGWMRRVACSKDC